MKMSSTKSKSQTSLFLFAVIQISNQEEEISANVLFHASPELRALRER
jgi:hypothetical protein